MRLMIVTCCFILIAGCSIENPTVGKKIGQIAKIQQAGLFCKTTEILVTGKFGGGELKLTVPSYLVAQAQAANESQQFVEINYHTDFINSICNNDTNNNWVDSITAHPQGSP